MYQSQFNSLNLFDQIVIIQFLQFDNIIFLWVYNAQNNHNIKNTMRYTKTIRTCITILKTMEEKYYLKYAILTSQMVFISVFILYLKLSPFLQNYTPLCDILEAIISISQFRYISYWIYTANSVLALSLLAHVHFSKNDYKMVVYLGLFCYFTAQLWVMTFVSAAFYIMLIDNSIQYLTGMLLSAPFLIIIIILEHKNQIYDKLIYLTLLFFVLFTESQWKLVTFCEGCYFLYQTPSKLMKWIYGSLTAMIAWSYIHMIYPSPLNGFELFYLVLLEVVLSVIIYFHPINIVKQNKYHYILELAKSIKKSESKKKISQETVINLQFAIASIEHTQSKCYLNVPHQQLINQKQHEISRGNLLDFLQSTVQITDRILLAEIKIEKGVDLFGILQILGEVTPHSIKQFVNIQKLKQKTEEVFASKVNIQIKIKDIQLVNQYLQYFYEAISAISDRLLQFWTYMSRPLIKANRMDSILTTVIQSQQKAQEFLNKIQKYKKCSQERHLYQSVCHLIDFYDQGSLISANIQLNKHKEQEEILKQRIDFDYFVIKNQNITSISKRFLHQISSDECTIIGMNYSFLFPLQVLPTIKSIIQNHENKTIILPILAHSKIVVKKIHIYLLPQFQEGSSHLFIIEKYQNPESIIIYDFTNDLILYFSSVFWKIQKAGYADDCLDLPNKVSNEVFKSDFSTPYFLQTMRNRKHVNTQFNWSKIAKNKFAHEVRRDKKNTQIKVSLELIEEYKYRDNTILLLSLFRGHYIRSQFQFSAANIFTNKSVQSTRKMNEDYTNQQFFCKVANPYQSTILQKLQSFKNGHRFNHLWKIGIAFGLLGALLITLLIISVIFSASRQSNYSSLLLEGSDLTSQYGNIILLFYYSYIRYHFKHYPSDLLQWDPRLNITDLSQYYEGIIKSQLQSCMTSELMNPLQKIKQNYQYIYQFGQFNTTAQTTETLNIVSLIQQTQKCLTTFNVSFLLNNYQTIRNLEDIYEAKDVSTGSISSRIVQSKIIMYIAFPIIFILILIIYLLLSQIKSAKATIYSVMAKTSFSQTKQILSNIATLRTNVKILNKAQKQYFRSSILTESVQKIQKEENKKDKQFIQQKAINLITDNLIYLWILISFAGCVVLYQLTLDLESQNFSNILAYMTAIQSSSNTIAFKVTDVMNSLIWQDLYNTPNTFGVTYNIKLETDFDNFDANRHLPNYFLDYRQIEREILYSDLCRFSYLNNISYFQSVQCHDIYAGSLNLGFSIVSELYRQSLVTLRKGQFSHLLQSKQVSAIEPVFIEAIYTRRIVMVVLSELSTIFTQTVNSYSQYLINYFEAVAAFIALYIIGIFAWWGWWMKNLIKQCQRARRGLRAIPREILLNIHTTREFIKSNFLMTMDRL